MCTRLSEKDCGGLAPAGGSASDCRSQARARFSPRPPRPRAPGAPPVGWGQAWLRRAPRPPGRAARAPGQTRWLPALSFSDKAVVSAAARADGAFCRCERGVYFTSTIPGDGCAPGRRQGRWSRESAHSQAGQGSAGAVSTPFSHCPGPAAAGAPGWILQSPRTRPSREAGGLRGARGSLLGARPARVFRPRHPSLTVAGLPGPGSRGAGARRERGWRAGVAGL